ncbi:MAG: hypothetical protein HC880_21675, partial [Bacteroidia bacterium]|nr:hypothetical protein [Bacteroidia bacterium]
LTWDWRVGELSQLKTLPYRYPYNDADKSFIIKYAPPIIYALWEGFMKNSFEIYARALNKLNLSREDFSIEIITHTIEVEFPQVKEPITDFTKTKSYVDKLQKFLMMISKLPLRCRLVPI